VAGEEEPQLVEPADVPQPGERQPQQARQEEQKQDYCSELPPQARQQQGQEPEQAQA